MRLSSSQYLSAATCLKQFEYAHVEHLAVKPSRVRDSLRRGTWIHRALEVYYQGGDWQDSVYALAAWASEHGVDDLKVTGLREEVCEIVEGYIDYWKANGEQWTVESMEESLEAEFGIHVISARGDGRIKTPTGRFLVENKSTIEIPSPQWRCIDPQTAIQWVVCQANGIEIDGIIFNYLLTKVPPKPKWKKLAKGQTVAEPYATTLTSVTTSRAFDQAIHEMGDERPGQLNLQDTLALRTRIVQDGAYYQRYVVYKQDQLLIGILRDVASTIRDLLGAARFNHYRRLSNMLYCPKFCKFSQLCATELTTGRRAEVLREEEFVYDDGVISREGVAR